MSVVLSSPSEQGAGVSQAWPESAAASLIECLAWPGRSMEGAAAFL